MNFSGVECTSSGLTKDSVEPHQQVTSREAREVLRKLAMLSLKMSHPPKVRSFSSASGTNFLMSGERASVRLPSRMVPICVSDPTGCALPLRTSSTPAMKVVLTAPMPGSSTPSFPLAGAILEGFSMPLLLMNDPNTIDGKIELKTRIAAAEACRVPKQTNNDEGRFEDLQIEGTGTSAPREHSFVGRQEF